MIKWNYLAKQVINVRDASIGAFGDGITDDYAAIEKAFKLLRNKGGVIHFPKGTYLISKPVNWINSADSDYSNIALTGVGIADTKLKFVQTEPRDTTDTGDPRFRYKIGIYLTGLKNRPLQNVAIMNMALEGATYGKEVYDDVLDELIQVSANVYNSSFTHLDLAGAHHAGIRFSSNTEETGQATLIWNCSFHHIGLPGMLYSGGAALLGSYPEQTISRCRFEHIGGTMYFHAIYGGLHDKIFIDGNTFLGKHSRIHFWSTPSQAVKIANNHFEDVCLNYFYEMPLAEICGNSFLNTICRVGSNGIRFIDNTFIKTQQGPLEKNVIGLISGDHGHRVVIERNQFMSMQSENGVFDCAVFISDAYLSDPEKRLSEWKIINNLFTGICQAIRTRSGDGHQITGNLISSPGAVPDCGYGVFEIESGQGHEVSHNSIWIKNSGMVGWRYMGKNSRFFNNMCNQATTPSQEIF